MNILKLNIDNIVLFSPFTDGAGSIEIIEYLLDEKVFFRSKKEGHISQCSGIKITQELLISLGYHYNANITPNWRGGNINDEFNIHNPRPIEPHLYRFIMKNDLLRLEYVHELQNEYLKYFNKTFEIAL